VRRLQQGRRSTATFPEAPKRKWWSKTTAPLIWTKSAVIHAQVPIFRRWTLYRMMLRCFAAILLAGLFATSATAANTDLPELIYTPWTKFCLKESCFVGRDGHSDPDCGPVVSVVLIARSKDLKTTLHVTLPARVNTERGVHIVIDDAQPIERPFVGCFANGCMAEYEAGQELIHQLKHGRDLKLQALDKANSPITITVPLADFANAYDGEPQEPKVFEMTTKKLQANIEERKSRCGGQSQ
jgi:invasion protein IalB